MVQNKMVPFPFFASHLAIRGRPFYCHNLRRRLSLGGDSGASKKHGLPRHPSSLDRAGLSARFDSPAPGYGICSNGELDSYGLPVTDR